MQIKWYGHAAFLLTTDAGVRIVIDPYQSGAFDGALAYGPITDEADIVLTSHDHDDHNYVRDIGGAFTRIDSEGVHRVKGVTVRAVPTYHDPSKGKERGKNLIFVVEADGMKIAHAGDLGHVLDGETAGKVGKVDVLLVPVGGFYTIDAREAWEVVEALAPAVTIPMHFKTEKCAFPIASVEEFVEGRKNVTRAGRSEAAFSRETLGAQRQVIVLKHAL